MQALRLLLLVVVLALAYLLMFRPQGKTTEELPPDLAQPQAAASPAHAHSQYKEAMDRAHAAAKQMQAQRADADSL